MNRLANFTGKIYFANSMQPIEMREHIPGLWLTRRSAVLQKHFVSRTKLHRVDTENTERYSSSDQVKLPRDVPVPTTQVREGLRLI
jgi:hypothetical protein